MAKVAGRSRLRGIIGIAIGRCIVVHLIVGLHRAVPDETEIAVASGAVEVPVDLVVSTTAKPTVHIAIEEHETIQDVYVVVEVLRVQDEDVAAVSHREASGLSAMVVQLALEHAQLVHACGTFRIHEEPLVDLHLRLREKQLVTGIKGR